MAPTFNGISVIFCLWLFLLPFPSLASQSDSIDSSADQLKDQASNGDAASLGQLQQAASAGDPIAEFELGVLTYQGQGTPQDWTLAASWFKKSAENEFA